MQILWRVAIEENNKQALATIFSNKFGDDVPNIESASKRFREIRNLGVTLEGIHFHCGSGQHGSSSF